MKARAKLTAEQRKRVREMMTDEGASRAEAVAWVLAFEANRAAFGVRVGVETPLAPMDAEDMKEIDLDTKAVST